MDLHRRRSVLVRMTEDGRKLETARIDNSPAALRTVLARAEDRHPQSSGPPEIGGEGQSRRDGHPPPG